MATIQLEIVSPDKVVYSKDIDMLIVRSTAGELGILPNHAPMVAGLVPHAMRVKVDGGEELIAVGGGFMEVQPKKISVLASAAEQPVDIDVNRAKEAYARAKARVEAVKDGTSTQEKDIDLARAEASLKRAAARLQVTGNIIE